jgi:hypothetical protein
MNAPEPNDRPRRMPDSLSPSRSVEIGVEASIMRRLVGVRYFLVLGKATT